MNLQDCNNAPPCVPGKICSCGFKRLAVAKRESTMAEYIKAHMLTREQADSVLDAHEGAARP